MLRRQSGPVVLAGLLLACQAPVVSEVPQWTGVVDFTLGGSGEPVGATTFQEIRGLHLGADGEILVTEHAASQLRLFTAAGELVAVGGSRGDGPGDLADICCATIADDGRIWVREDGNLRYSVFTVASPRLAFVEHVRMPFTSPRGFEPLRWDATNQLIDLSSVRIPGHPLMAWRRAMVTGSGEAARVDTILPPPEDSIEVYHHVGQINGATVSGTYYSQFGPSPVVAIGPGGEYATAVSTHYAITWFTPTGHRIALLRGTGEGPLLSAAEREESDARDARISERLGARLPFRTPERKPVLLRIGFDLDGRLWVQRNVPAGAPRHADVWDRSGHRIASVTWPATIQLTGWAIRGAVGLGVQTEADGEIRVVRLHFH